MSVFDRRRLPSSVFKLDVERMRRGWYSDKYFINIADTLRELARRGYRFGGHSPELSASDLDLATVDVGSLEVEVQWFTRRQPSTVVVGVDKALAMLAECTGYFDEAGRFVSTFDAMEVWAVHDGSEVAYDGDPLNVNPVMRVRGRYRDFALLETPTLGALTRGSRVATNVYEVMKAARGKQVLFFPARFDAHEVQAADGYAYQVAVQLFNQNFGKSLPAHVSTDAQGDWWGGAGGGTVSHAAIACFLGDTAEAMLALASTMAPDVPRIAVVDFQNDCVGTSLAVIRTLFPRYLERSRPAGPRRRSATSSSACAPTPPPTCATGRCRRSATSASTAASTRAWCSCCASTSTASGSPGASRARTRASPSSTAATSRSPSPAASRRSEIRQFEELSVPADIYGVGSWLLSSCDVCGTSNDFTADVVRVRIDGRWLDLAKVGRKACDNLMLERVQ